MPLRCTVSIECRASGDDVDTFFFRKNEQARMIVELDTNLSRMCVYLLQQASNRMSERKIHTKRMQCKRNVDLVDML